MSIAELQELDEIKRLVERGQRFGVLTYAEVAAVVSGLDLDEGELEELAGYVENAAIELVKELDPGFAFAEGCVQSSPVSRRRWTRRPR